METVTTLIHPEIGYVDQKLNIAETFSKTESLLKKGQYLHAHTFLLDLEAERDDRMFEVHKFVSQDKKLELLSDELEKSIWSHTKTIYKSRDSDLDDLLPIISIIQHEEESDKECLTIQKRTGFIPIGRPKQFHKRFFDTFEEAVGEKLGEIQQEGILPKLRNENENWVARYLELCRRTVLEDLLRFKQFNEVSMRHQEFDVFKNLPNFYHKELCKIVGKLCADIDCLSKKEIYQILNWQLHYCGPELFGNHQLDVDVSEYFGEFPLLTESQLQCLYCKFLEMNSFEMQEWLDKVLAQEREVSITNNCGICADNADKLKIHVNRSRARGQHNDELIRKIDRIEEKWRRICQISISYLIRELVMDMGPFLAELMTNKWLEGSEAFGTVCATVHDYFNDHRHLTPDIICPLLMGIQYAILKEYISALGNRRLVVKKEEDRHRIADKIKKDAEMLKDMFDQMVPEGEENSDEGVFEKFHHLTDVLTDMADVICSEMTQNVSGFAQKYPDCTEDQLSALIKFTEPSIDREERRKMAADIIHLTRNLRRQNTVHAKLFQPGHPDEIVARSKGVTKSMENTTHLLLLGLAVNHAGVDVQLI